MLQRRAPRLRAARPSPMTEQERRPMPVPTGTSERPPTTSAPPRGSGESMVPPPVVELPTVGSTQLWNKKVKVVEQIGRGGMSYVVRGTDTTLRRELALKVSPVPRERMPVSLLARFIQEAQVTAQLEHPNVVPVHELGLDPEGRAYFTMKLVRGQSLQEILDLRRAGDDKTLSEFGLRRLLDVFLHVC